MSEDGNGLQATNGRPNDPFAVRPTCRKQATAVDRRMLPRSFVGRKSPGAQPAAGERIAVGAKRAVRRYPFPIAIKTAFICARARAGSPESLSRMTSTASA